MDDILDVKQLAETLGIGVETVRRLTRSRSSPYVGIGGSTRYRLSDILDATRVNRHSDDDAVDRFAGAMREKMRTSREKGRAGWEKCDPDVLRKLLRVAVEKGDPVDVGDFAMMLHDRGERTA